MFAVPSVKRETPESMSFVKRLARGIEDLGTKVHVLRVVKSANPLDFLRQGMALRRLIHETSPALVVAQFGTYTGLLVALFSRGPVVITYRGSDLNPDPSTNRLMQAVQHGASHLASFFADGIVCVSRELSNRLLIGTRREVIPSPIDLDLSQPMDPRESRRVLGWDEGQRTAVFLGGRNPKLKGIDLAEDVRRELLRRRSPVDLRIVGHEIPIASVPVYLNAADCLLSLSRFEGSPNLVREACACNLPVVATPAGDIEDVLRDVVPARMVSHDVNEVADAVEDICRLGVRSNGRDHVAEYSTARISRRSLEFYEAIVKDYSRGNAH